jgi:CRISPR-associated protein Csx10
MTAAGIVLPWQIPWSVTFHSDWTVGTGRGSVAGLDQRVRLDPEGLPFIPGKTATGIWRDALERALQPFAAADPTAATWHEALLGTAETPPARVASRRRPCPAAVGVRGARMSPALQRYLGARPGLTEVLRLVQPGVEIEWDRRVAAGRMLRQIERARTQLTLHGYLEIDQRVTASWSPQQQRIAAALLVLAAREIHHIGGNRRRGAGRCTADVAQLGTTMEAVKVLTTEFASTPVPQPQTPAEPDQPLQTAGNRASAVIDLRLECLLPIMIPARTLGNIRTGLDFIPGTVMLAEVADRLRAVGLDADDAIRSGTLTLTDATTEVAGQRGLPIPACLAAPKHSAPLRGATWNRALEQAPPGPRLKLARGAYVGLPAGDRLPPAVEVLLVSQTHNVVDDYVQRPTGRVGGVYTYQAIPSGTVLRCELTVPREWVRQATEELAGFWRLGRARKDEYGSVLVHAGLHDGDLRRPTASVGAHAVEKQMLAEALIWFTSTTLIVDEWLQSVTDAAGVRRCLESALTATGQWQGTVTAPYDPELIPAVVTIDRRESWHARWGLPRPSLVGVGGGSVIRCRFEPQVPAAALRHIAAEGLGERRAEGFGRLLVDPEWLTRPTSDRAPAESLTPAHTPVPASVPVDALSRPERTLVAALEEALLRREITIRAEGLAPLDVLAGGHADALEAVPRAQWGALRERAQAAMLGDLDALSSVPELFVSSLARRQSWSSATASVKDALTQLVSGDQVWRLIGLGPDASSIAELGIPEDAIAQLRAELHPYAVASVLLAALSRIRRSRRGVA